MLEVLARIRHRRARRRLSPYLDGMLSDAESRRLEAHLAQCRACRDELAELQATVRTLAGLPLVEAPRSFALTAAPQRAAAVPPSRRLELGLGLATAAAAFALALVAFGDLLGVPEDERDEDAALRNIAGVQAEPTVAGIFQELVTPQAPVPVEGAGEGDRATAEASTAPPSAMGPGEEATAAPPEVTAIAPEEGVPGAAEPPTVAATATLAAATPPAPTPAPAATPMAVEALPQTATAIAAETATPGQQFYYSVPPSGDTSEAEATPPEKAIATATPGLVVVPAEPEGNLTALAQDQALAESQRQAQAADEDGGPSRETVVRWLEIGLASGMALLFVSWVLARRWGRA